MTSLTRDELWELFIHTIADECPEAVESLADAANVEEWAEKYRLTKFPRIFDHAHKTRELWEMFPKIDLLEYWHCVDVGEWRLVLSPVFNVQWDPRSPALVKMDGERGIFVGGSKTEAKDRIFKAINQYLNRVETIEKAAGFEQHPLRTRDGRTPSDRMKWVVMHLCRRMTFDEIRRALDDSPENSSSVRKAVHDLIQNLNFD